jgi:hypothetical protein
LIGAPPFRDSVFNPSRDGRSPSLYVDENALVSTAIPIAMVPVINDEFLIFVVLIPITVVVHVIMMRLVPMTRMVICPEAAAPARQKTAGCDSREDDFVN